MQAMAGVPPVFVGSGRVGHNHDKTYDSVIMHIIALADCEAHQSTGESVPRLQLVCPGLMYAG